MSQEMHRFGVINVAASESLLRHLVKADILAYDGNRAHLEKLRVVAGPEIGYLMHDCILCLRIFLFFVCVCVCVGGGGRFRKIVESDFYLRRVCQSVCPHGTTRVLWGEFFKMKFGIWGFFENLFRKL
jgi:hypothetical protein